MGQVFVWDTVRKGNVPQPESYPLVIDLLREAVMRESSVVGSLICGSVVRGDHTRRSDIDWLVLYDPAQENQAFRFMQNMTAHAVALHVPLGPVPCDVFLASQGMHHVGPSFRRHLQKSLASGGLHKGDPLGCLVAGAEEREELVSYLRVKMYHLQEAWSLAGTFSEERTVGYLKKLLEAPLHVARKVLALQLLLEDDSKAEVIARYQAAMTPSMADQLTRLVALDRQYTELLETQLSQPDEEVYRAYLRHLLGRSGEVLQFIRSNLAYVAETAR